MKTFYVEYYLKNCTEKIMHKVQGESIESVTEEELSYLEKPTHVHRIVQGMNKNAIQLVPVKNIITIKVIDPSPSRQP